MFSEIFLFKFLFSNPIEQIILRIIPELLLDHNEYLKRVTPPGKLHFFDVKDGWEPLCKILNLPVPDQPFPHAHDAETIRKEIEGWVKLAIRRWLLILGVGSSIAITTWVLWKRR